MVLERRLLILAATGLLLGLALYSVRSSVATIKRSTPSGREFSMSHTAGSGQRQAFAPASYFSARVKPLSPCRAVVAAESAFCRGVVEQRFGVTQEGRPLTVLRCIAPANDTAKGAYKSLASSPPPHLHLYQVRIFLLCLYPSCSAADVAAFIRTAFSQWTDLNIALGVASAVSKPCYLRALLPAEQSLHSAAR